MSWTLSLEVGDSGHFFFLIIGGSIEIIDARERILATGIQQKMGCLDFIRF